MQSPFRPLPLSLKNKNPTIVIFQNINIKYASIIKKKKAQHQNPAKSWSQLALSHYLICKKIIIIELVGVIYLLGQCMIGVFGSGLPWMKWCIIYEYWLDFYPCIKLISYIYIYIY